MQEASIFRFAVGTLTRSTSYFERAEGDGISIVEFNGADGQFSVISTTAGIDNPTHLCFSHARKTLYANSEVEGWNEGTVSAYKLDEATGALIYLNKQVTLGSIAAHNSLSSSGRHLFVTNYSHEDAHETPRKAMAVFPVRPDGGLDPASGSVLHEGRGPSEVRQRVPHPHCAMISHDGMVVSVADLGLDRILHYAFDDMTGRVKPSPLGASRLPPASGPRHFVEAQDGRTIYVINELASTIAVMRRSPGEIEWSLIQIASTLPHGFEGASLCAAIHLSPDGRHLYGSNRGHDSIAGFAIEAAGGELTPMGWTSTGGRTPRSFLISADGYYVMVANQNENEIVAFARDPRTGSLQSTDAKLAIGTPMCVTNI